MKFITATIATVALMQTAEACPAFRFRYGGSAKKAGDECLSADSTGQLSVVACDDLDHAQMIEIEGSTLGSHMMGGTMVAADIVRTNKNTFTVAISGKCIGKNGKLVKCPTEETKPGLAKKASWFIEPLIGSDSGMSAGHDDDDGHDHGAPATMPATTSWSSYSYAPAGHSADDGHDHGATTMNSYMPAAGHSADDGHDHGAPATTTSWSSYSYMPAGGHSADDGHDHGAPATMSGGHSADDGHDHGAPAATSSWSAYSYMPAGHSTDDGHDHSGSGGMSGGHSADDGHDHGGGGSSMSMGNCQFVNGRIQCF